MIKFINIKKYRFDLLCRLIKNCSKQYNVIGSIGIDKNAINIIINSNVEASSDNILIRFENRGKLAKGYKINIYVRQVNNFCECNDTPLE